MKNSLKDIIMVRAKNLHDTLDQTRHLGKCRLLRVHNPNNIRAHFGNARMTMTFTSSKFLQSLLQLARIPALDYFQ